jgi:hypothetical protein
MAAGHAKGQQDQSAQPQAAGGALSEPGALARSGMDRWERDRSNHVGQGAGEIGPGHDARISELDALAVCPLPMSFAAPDPQLLLQLVQASRAFDATGNDAERNCWLAVHQHVHGVLPSEYDIREVPEDLYLAVLALRKAESGHSGADLSQ